MRAGVRTQLHIPRTRDERGGVPYNSASMQRASRRRTAHAAAHAWPTSAAVLSSSTAVSRRFASQVYCMEPPPPPWLSVLGKQQLLEAAATEFDALVPSSDRPNACRALALLLRVRLLGCAVVTRTS